MEVASAFAGLSRVGTTALSWIRVMKTATNAVISSMQLDRKPNLVAWQTATGRRCISRASIGWLRWESRLELEQLEHRELLSGDAVHSIDGTGNNLLHPDWGSTDELLLRFAPAEYGDGISSPSGVQRPSAREISNELVAHSNENTLNERDLTAYIYVWGQFLDHDLDLTKSASPTEIFNIQVPVGDPLFDPNSTGTQVIPLKRSVFNTSTGTNVQNPRQQINQVSAWIDGSMIYGSDSIRSAALRTFLSGKLNVLETAVGQLPPLNTLGLPNNNDAHRSPDNELFLAGDVRSNENIELTSMHTLFIREHNRLANEIAAADGSLSDEQIYQRARALVIAELQVITYREWLPALLGQNALKPYRGYNQNVNPSIANEFSTAAFRLHSTINDDVEFFDNNGRPIKFSYVNEAGQTIDVNGEIALFEAFSNPNLFKQTGVDGILKYAASTHAEELDNQIVDSLRNFLFGKPGQGGLDLASLNIQRGRDHGLGNYNAVRDAYGLPRVTSFAQITTDPDLRKSLQSLYGNVNNIDLWVGGLAEDHVRGSSTGPLIQRILSDQFARLRDGDRFWYQRSFSGSALAQLERTTLADIIERNTGVEGLQDNVFFFKAEIRGHVFIDRDGNGARDRGEPAIPGVLVQLYNDEGVLIASTRTGSHGNYTFASFHETGDYQVRVVVDPYWEATTPTSIDALISSGDKALNVMKFGLRPLWYCLTQPSVNRFAKVPAWNLANDRLLGRQYHA